MRLLLDENISRYICERLIVDGHDVVRCQDVDAGKADTEVLAFATVNNLTVLTEDTDFGELAMRQHLQSGGVILLRLSGMARAAQPDYVAHTVSAHVQAITLPPAEAAAWAAKGAALIELFSTMPSLSIPMILSSGSRRAMCLI
jgi:predicted nuclease of predicted toxin-antitoxin system